MRRTPITIIMTGPIQAEINTLAADAAPRETGGLVLGWWHSADTVIVRHAIAVPDTHASRVSWVRHPHAAAKALADALTELAHPLIGYVGDWHSHPSPCDASTRDRLSITETSRQYPNPIVLLVHLPDGTFDAHAAQAGRLRAATTQERGDTWR